MIKNNLTNTYENMRKTWLNLNQKKIDLINNIFRNKLQHERKKNTIKNVVAKKEVISYENDDEKNEKNDENKNENLNKTNEKNDVSRLMKTNWCLI